MSHYSAHLIYGYELKPDWKEVIPQEFFQKNFDCFISVNLNDYDEGFTLFGINWGGCKAGSYTQIPFGCPHTPSEDEAFDEFVRNYLAAATHHLPAMYIAGVIA